MNNAEDAESFLSWESSHAEIRNPTSERHQTSEQPRSQSLAASATIAQNDCPPSRRRIRRFNARQRKKFAVGEFQEFVFEVKIGMVEGLDEDAADDFLDRLLAFLQSRKLVTVALSDRVALTAFILGNDRTSPDEEDRAAVSDWLSRQEHVATFSTGELVDANYTSFDD